MTSWKRPGSTNNSKPPSPGLGSSLQEKASDQQCLRNRLGAASLLSQTLALTSDSQDPGREESLQRIKELDPYKGSGPVPGCSKGETEPEGGKSIFA